MNVYLSLAQIGDLIDSHYRTHHTRMHMLEAVTQLLDEHQFLTTSPNLEIIRRLTSASEEEFLSQRNTLCAEFDPEYVREYAMTDDAIPYPSNIPDAGWSEGLPASVIANPIFYLQASSPHSDPDYFEFDYVYQGQCTLLYENTTQTMTAGTLCLIAPSAIREIRKDTKDTFLIQLYLNYEAFYSAFISVLSDNNILSNFFKAVLLNKEKPNFLMINTSDSPDVRFIARQLFLEQYRYDNYSPICSTNWMQQLFFSALRSVETDYHFTTPSSRIDFAPILKYLSVHYRSTSLQEVADKFHYTPSYLSMAIKEISGKNYTELIREMKMHDACHLLETTKKTIEEITTLSGYNSADQFTRAFRTAYGITPSKYRKTHSERKTAE